SSDEKEKSSSMEEEEDDKEESKKDSLEQQVRKNIQHSVQNVTSGRQEVEKLVGDLISVFQEWLSNSSFPVPQPAIGVDSAFEGWRPCGHDAVYCLLVPLKPPCGHSFHPELGTVGDAPEKHRVRVKLQCTCLMDTGAEDMLCLVHQACEAIERNKSSCLLSYLCTSHYLDAEKTARWFQNLMDLGWRNVPHSRHYSMRMLPSRRSCKLELTSASGTLFVEVIFGVQQGDSDIFLSSQAPETIVSPDSMMWAESYAVAEAKYFSLVARRALHDSVHLKCLQLCASTLEGTVLSSYVLKTVGMHVLNMIPMTSWTRAVLAIQLQDIICYLRSCLEKKRLDHFIVGNKSLPKDIILPPAIREAKPFNLFQCLVQDPEAYAKALCEFEGL
ncbi:IPIL1 protein, partial [Nycticryphes semicollaris]|nr:IPIL1 protein [Nycticryphes semicollaris]